MTLHKLGGFMIHSQPMGRQDQCPDVVVELGGPQGCTQRCPRKLCGAGNPARLSECCSSLQNLSRVHSGESLAMLPVTVPIRLLL